jgi:hypothetical protein
MGNEHPVEERRQQISYGEELGYRQSGETSWHQASLNKEVSAFSYTSPGSILASAIQNNAIGIEINKARLVQASAPFEICY